MEITIKQNYNKYGFPATTCYEIYSKDCTIFLGYVYSHYRHGRTKWYFRNDDINVFGERHNRKSAIDALKIIGEKNESH